MIRFFRHLRQRLLTENQINRYLLYAVGEIVLVVIGILLALQLNNWNEDRKGQARKNALLHALSVEFSTNLKQLDSVIRFDERVVNATRNFINLNPDEAKSTPNDTLRVWLQNTSWLWTFDPQNGALRSGISSGDIHLIQNDSLINLLFSWQDVVADASENEARHIRVRLESNPIIAPFVRKVDYRTTLPGIGKSKFASDYQALIRDPLFEDYVAERYGHTLDALNELDLVRKQNIEILRLIDHELDLGE